MQTFCERLKTRLYPRVYRREARKPDSCCLLLVQRHLLVSRYALAVYEWESAHDGPTQLRVVRREVAKALWAVPVLAEVGLYLIFCGPHQEWVTQVTSMPADKTGLHRIIVQAVHCLDLQTGEQALNQSAWGPIRFGGVDSVAAVIDAILT